jgi:hypothetical protein
VADVVLADALEPTPEAGAEEEPAAAAGPVELTTDQLDAFVGHWRASMGIEVEIRRIEDRLVFIQDGGRSPLVTMARDRLRLEAADIDMVASRQQEGKFTFMNVDQRGARFTAERFDPELESVDISSLLGEFYSEELDVTYRLYEGDAGLILEIPPARTTRVYMSAENQVRTPFGILLLEREGDTITGFSVDAGRAQGIVFRRVRGNGPMDPT